MVIAAHQEHGIAALNAALTEDITNPAPPLDQSYFAVRAVK